MAEIPELHLNAKGPLVQGRVNPSTAGAMGEALSDIGKDVYSVASDALEADIEIRDREDYGHIAETRTRLQTIQREHDTWRLENPQVPPSEWKADMEGRFETVREFAGTRQMLPRNQQQLDAIMDNAQIYGAAGVAQEAKIESLRRADIATDTLRDELEKDGRWDEAAEVERGRPGATKEETDRALFDQQGRKEADDERRALTYYEHEVEPENIREAMSELDRDSRIDGADKPRVRTLLQRRLTKASNDWKQDAWDRVQEPDPDEPEKRIVNAKQLEDFVPEWVEGRDDFVKQWKIRKQPLTPRERGLMQAGLDELMMNFLKTRDARTNITEDDYLRMRDEVRAKMWAYSLRDDAKGLMRQFASTEVADMRARADQILKDTDDSSLSDKQKALAGRARIHFALDLEQAKTGNRFDGIKGTAKKAMDETIDAFILQNPQIENAEVLTNEWKGWFWANYMDEVKDAQNYEPSVLPPKEESAWDKGTFIVPEGEQGDPIKLDRRYVYDKMQVNKDVPWVKRFLDANDTRTLDRGNGTWSTHSLAHEVTEDGEWRVFPTVVPNENGNLVHMELRKAQAKADREKNYISFGKGLTAMEEAAWFTKNYKMIWEKDRFKQD